MFRNDRVSTSGIQIISNFSDNIKTEWQSELKTALLQTLAGYCFLCSDKLNENQYNIMEVIASHEHSYDSEEDYKLVRAKSIITNE